MEVIDGKNYVNKAEEVIKGLLKDAEREAKGYYSKILTTSQIRKQLAMTAELSSRAERETSDTLGAEIQNDIEYLRVQFVYQAGRDMDVKKFIEKAEVLKILKSINGAKRDFLTFCRYMEALVAYRKFYGGEDK